MTGVMNGLFVLSSVLSAVGLIFLPIYAFQTTNSSKNTNFPYTRRSISWAIASTPDELLVDSLMILTNFAILFIAAGREIQLRVIFTRADKYTGFLSFVNILDGVLLGIAALSWIVAVIFDTGDYDFVHFVSASIGWGLSLLHQLIHLLLTLYQRRKCYNCDNEQRVQGFMCRYYELLYLIITWCISTCFSIIFVMYQLNDKIPEWINEPFGSEKRYFYEWWAFWIMATYYIILGIIFYRDPVDDELKEFFGGIVCCKECKGKEGSAENVRMQLERGEHV